MRVLTLRGDQFDVSSCSTTSEVRQEVARHHVLPAEELLLLCGRDVLNETHLNKATHHEFRVVHRPPPPSHVPLRYAGLVAYSLTTTWFLCFNASVPGVMATLIALACLRWMPRHGWQRLAPPPPPRKNDVSPSKHLIVVPLYNESEVYLEPMLASLLEARCTWPLTVLFAAEPTMDTYWLKRAELRLEEHGITASTVRHPCNLLNEVPGAASNLNWALETFCFESSNPLIYLMTKCDSNGVVDVGYLEEIEHHAKKFGNSAFFLQPPVRWKFSKGWSLVDHHLLAQFARLWNIGEGGLAHFSLPLAQFIAVGRYSHSSLRVMDDMDCYLQQEAYGATSMMTTSSIVKCCDARSDIASRYIHKWVPQFYGTAIAEPSMRRYVVFFLRGGLSTLTMGSCFKLFLILKSFLFLGRDGI